MLRLRALLARARSWRPGVRQAPARSLPAVRGGYPPAPPAPPAAVAPARQLPGEAAAEEPITLLAILCTAEERAAFARIAAAGGWTLHLTDSHEQARALLAATPVPLIVVDRDLPGSDWRQVVPALAGLPHAPCVLLASTVADEYLWLEISRRGGHDILPKPFQRESTTRVVTFAWAWRRWTLGTAKPAAG